MKKLLLLCTTTIALAAISPHSPVANESQTDLFRQAVEHMSREQYRRAAPLLEQVVFNDSLNAGAWYRLGMCNHFMGEYDAAIDAYHHATDLGFSPGRSAYNLACSFSLAGELDSAFTTLNTLVDEGFNNLDQLQSDGDLKPLRQDSRWNSLIAKADHNARPCAYDERYRQLDFWLGDWDAYNGNGQIVGHNKITKELDGCMILESWGNPDAVRGQSINYFDPSDGKWHQNWVSASGNVVRYTGEVLDGVLHYTGKHILKDGTVTTARVTLTPNDDGSVHHLIEHRKDGGDDWTVYFDAIYRSHEN